MKQAEKALRDAGWEEINLRETCQGDEVYDLDEHDTYVINCPALPTWEGRVLRAPRSEPEYEPGTVARVRCDREEFNAICLSGGTDGLPSWNGKYFLHEVEVLRILAYPDGAMPDDADYDAGFEAGYQEGAAMGNVPTEGDTRALIEGMVPCVARALYYQNGGFSWDEATGGYRGEFERDARIALGEAYKEATK